jgi:cell division protein ZapA
VNKEVEAVKVNILDKEYLVACPEEERDELLASARFLNERMIHIREAGKVVGIDRIAVMTALNLAHDVIKAGGANGTESCAVRLGRLNTSIEQALEKYRQRELN